MPDLRIEIRRARRTDFTAVMALLAASGMAVPPPERATLRRFRYVVADLGTDFYLAFVDDALAGLVHVTYARRLTVRPRAWLAELVVGTPFRHRGVATALLAFARERARRRGCGTLSGCVPAADSAARAFLHNAGLQAIGEWFSEDLLDGSGGIRTDAAE
jgi:GNAT superfamily N-acetyltransferase